MNPACGPSTTPVTTARSCVTPTVTTSRPCATRPVPQEWAGRQSPFTFVTDGIRAALAQARAVAGEKDVGIGGGADVIRQYLAAGLVDELRLHVAPVLLGAGFAPSWPFMCRLPAAGTRRPGPAVVPAWLPVLRVLVRGGFRLLRQI
jgi:hypothetical protein